MFSIPKPATTTNFLNEMKETLDSLINADLISRWFIKRRFVSLCKASSMYVFSQEEKIRYISIVNSFHSVSNYEVTSEITNELDKPLIS